jgi:hypothetical protein
MKRSSREHKRRNRARKQDRKAFSAQVDAFAAELRSGVKPNMFGWGLWGCAALWAAQDRVFGPPSPLTFEDVMAWGRGEGVR